MILKIKVDAEWKSGPCEDLVPGLYLFRHKLSRNIVFADGTKGYVNQGFEYIGPVEFETNEPLPELIQIPGWCEPIINELNNGWRIVCNNITENDIVDCIEIIMRNKRKAIEVFNAAAKAVMNG